MLKNIKICNIILCVTLNSKMNSKQIGNAGEDLACKFLQKKGYKIIDRNWRNREGEIDIIAEQECKNEKILIFVEVKTLPNGTSDMLLKELGKTKQKKIIKTSKCYLLNHRQYNNRFIRFDVIVLDMPGYEKVYHIENAFSELL